MKPLQNNFTTPEQSRRLLELGLPFQSADLHWIVDGYHKIRSEMRPMIGKCFKLEAEFPCWSVGRLIEIIMLCNTNTRWNLMTPTATTSLTDFCMEAIEVALTEGDINFSKLED